MMVECNELMEVAKGVPFMQFVKIVKIVCDVINKPYIDVLARIAEEVVQCMEEVTE